MIPPTSGGFLSLVVSEDDDRIRAGSAPHGHITTGANMANSGDDEDSVAADQDERQSTDTAGTADRDSGDDDDDADSADDTISDLDPQGGGLDGQEDYIVNSDDRQTGGKTVPPPLFSWLFRIKIDDAFHLQGLEKE